MVKVFDKDECSCPFKRKTELVAGFVICLKYQGVLISFRNFRTEWRKWSFICGKSGLFGLDAGMHSRLDGLALPLQADRCLTG